MIQEKFDHLKEMIETFHDPVKCYTDLKYSVLKCAEDAIEGDVAEDHAVENIIINMEALIIFYQSHPEACVAFMQDLIEYDDIIEVQDLKKAKA